MPNIIPKSSTYFTVVGCFALIIFGGAFWHGAIEVLQKRLLFSVPLIIFFIAFVGATAYWLSSLKDPAYEYFSARMWPVVLLAALTFAWIAGWGSQYVADKSDHIEYNGK